MKKKVLSVWPPDNLVDIGIILNARCQSRVFVKKKRNPAETTWEMEELNKLSTQQGTQADEVDIDNPDLVCDICGKPHWLSLIHI